MASIVGRTMPQEHAAGRADGAAQGNRRRSALGTDADHDGRGAQERPHPSTRSFLNMYEGQFYVRSEISENAPDVVQAFSDAFAEATLWIRLNPEKAADSWPRIPV